MSKPTVATLSPGLQDLQRRWLDLPRKQQDELYATEFAPPFAKLFADLPLHGTPEPFERPRALVSVLGFSWQPVALMAAWAHPERMLIIGTKESLDMKVADEGVVSLISRLAGLSRDSIRAVEAGDPGEADIYRAVRDFLSRSGVPARQVFIDPTGGKKSMSSSAALAGFLAGAPLVYVDYADYHGPNRIPVAGTEYPRLLVNPLEVLGDLELRDIFGAFNRSDFVEARHLANKLAFRLYEPREGECLAMLAEGYSAWDRFNFQEAHVSLQKASELLQQFGAQGGWTWGASTIQILDENIAALKSLSQLKFPSDHIEDGVPLFAWYFAAAQRLLAADKPSLAVLLTYAAVERYIDLCLWVDFGLDDESPDYGGIADKLDRQKYDKAGQQIFGKKYTPRDLAGPLMFGNGAQLLATLNDSRLSLNDLGLLQGLANARNKCEYEHGLLPKTPSRDEVERYLTKAIDIVSHACGGQEELRRRMDKCRFPVLI